MKFETNKFESGLIFDYQSILSPLKYKKITLMEIGVSKGGSLDFWASYLKHPDTKIIGLDYVSPKVNLIKKKVFPQNVTFYKCNQNDSENLEIIARKEGPFDIIIDDASHQKIETENCFSIFFDHMVLGGYYIIEDWNVGYMPEPQYHGMVKLITNIIENTPQLGIEELNVILKQRKAVAFFKKGEFLT